MPAIIETGPVLQPGLAPPPEQLYPIREVARLTGVNPVTLRAWERRYGLIHPTRTESGHRLYSMSDIERVRSILDWIDRGVAVSKVGKILAKAAPLQGLSHIIPRELVHADHAQWQDQLQSAVSAFDVVQLDQVYGQIFSSYPLSVVFQDILLPVWKRLQQRQQAFGHVSEWFFFDGFLRSRVVQRLSLTRVTPGSRVVVCALSDRCQELELLVAALLLSNSDYALQVMAVGQPFDELTLVCERIKPQALVLFSNHAPAAQLPQQLKRLALSIDCQLLLAGEVAELAQENLLGTAIGCLGNEGTQMRQRLKQFLAGSLDT
ncbi:MerR family transcriptional regulator [Pseudomonas sp. PB3P13]